MEIRDALQSVLEDSPASIRALARAAGVSHALLVAIRAGERRMTPATRDALVAALRRWSRKHAELADALEAAELEP